MDEKLSNVINEIRKIPRIICDDNKEYETIDTYEGLWISKISVTLDNKLILN
tara:strand:- start:6684 stop:6839 length:156 start_codon:yes stop_codon:yes gene_type:complete